MCIYFYVIYFCLGCSDFVSITEQQWPSLAHRDTAGGPHLGLASTSFFQANKVKNNPTSPRESQSATLETLPYVQKTSSLPG